MFEQTPEEQQKHEQEINAAEKKRLQQEDTQSLIQKAVAKQKVEEVKKRRLSVLQRQAEKLEFEKEMKMSALA